MSGEETHNIEYKQKWNVDCLKAISAIANANRGMLYTGLIDNAYYLYCKEDAGVKRPTGSSG